MSTWLGIEHVSIDGILIQARYSDSACTREYRYLEKKD